MFFKFFLFFVGCGWLLWTWKNIPCRISQPSQRCICQIW